MYKSVLGAKLYQKLSRYLKILEDLHLVFVMKISWLMKESARLKPD